MKNFLLSLCAMCATVMLNASNVMAFDSETEAAEQVAAGASADDAVILALGENEVSAFACDEEGYTYFTYTADETGKVLVKATPSVQLFMGGAYLAANMMLGGPVIDVVQGETYVLSAKLTEGQAYVFKLEMQAPDMTYTVRYNPDETVAVVFLTPGTQGNAINYGIGVPVLSETYTGPIALEYNPDLDPQGTGACTYLIIALEEGSMNRVFIQVTVKKAQEEEVEEWIEASTEEYEDYDCHMVEGTLKVKCEDGKITVKDFDGAEGYDLIVAFDEEDNATSISILSKDGEEDATAGWVWSGKSYWYAYTDGYSFAGYDEEGGYVLVAAYVGDDYVYYYVAWDNLTVGVANVVKMEQGAMYDLSGRRIEKAAKGQVFIQNGKKIVQK